MKHEAIKKAVFRANIRDADVALRALDRIDKDEAFRDAVQAVIDVDDDDGKKLNEVIYAHFEPIKHRHGQSFRDRPAFTVEQLGVSISAKEVTKLVNDQQLEVLIHLLSNDAIEQRLVRFVADHLEAIVLGIMGLKKDSYRGYVIEEWNNRKSPAGNAVRARIQELAVPIFKEALDKIDLYAIANDVITKDGGKQIKEFYERAAKDAMREAASKRAHERAHTDVEKFMKDFFGEGEDDDESA